MKAYQRFQVHIENKIATVKFNRPEKANALDKIAWEEMKDIFETLHHTPEARVIILAGEGRSFCAGIDLNMLMDISSLANIKCEGRKRETFRENTLWLQSTITAIEKCRKPVIAAIHGACVGGGVDIITACDMRYCSEDAYFAIREVDMGLVADIGTFQRLPKIINPGMMAELSYTGRKVSGKEAQEIGLVTRTYADQEQLMAGVQELAAMIASKSPLVIRGTKENLLYTRDHTVEESLNYVVTWNAGMIISDDLSEAFQAKMMKRQATFED